MHLPNPEERTNMQRNVKKPKKTSKRAAHHRAKARTEPTSGGQELQWRDNLLSYELYGRSRYLHEYDQKDEQA